MAGMFLVRYAEKVHSRLKVRAITLADEDTKLVIAVVDSVGVPRDILDEAKRRASLSTGIAADRMLISATHTHTAPPVRTAHGTDPDPQYAELLTRGIVTAIERATAQLVPAQIGVAVVDAGGFAAVRRWVLRPDRIREDPFGNKTVRASMHTASNHDNVTGPSGPMDPDLSIVAFQTRDGRPLAMLANFANHYAGAPKVDGELAISADYFGLFADSVEQSVAGKVASDPADFVAVMSQGTSGDIATRDYWHLDQKRAPFEQYTQGMVELALNAYRGIEYRADVELEMAQSELELPFQLPNVQRLEWARRVYGELGSGRVPENLPEVYARHALNLDQGKSTKLLLQAIRVGDVGITAIPNEVYGLTGLQLKEVSPLPTTINIELANGSLGYLPPPEQHVLGGYNTWPALSSCLETDAEPRIVQGVLQLLETVSSKPRRTVSEHRGPASAAVLDAQPVSYFRMHEFSGPRAVDSVARHDGIYESGTAFYLSGPGESAFSNAPRGNRAVHFAGGRLRLAPAQLSADAYSVSLWFWNGLLTDVRPITGYLLSQDRDRGLSPSGVHVGIGGTEGRAGHLMVHAGVGEPAAVGSTRLQRWHWHHLVMVRTQDRVQLFLDGALEASLDIQVASEPSVEQLFVAGRSDGKFNFEGRVDEVALFDRALTPDDVAALYSAAD